jgi:uncharacterized membrane protein
MAEDCEKKEEEKKDRSVLDILWDIVVCILDFFLTVVLIILIIDFLLGLITALLAFIFGALFSQILVGLFMLLGFLWLFYRLGQIFIWRVDEIFKKLRPDPNP